MDFAALFRSNTLPPAAKVVAAYLAWVVKSQSRPTQQDIADGTGLSVRCVRSSLRALEELGSLQVTPSPGAASTIRMIDTPENSSGLEDFLQPFAPAEFADPGGFRQSFAQADPAGFRPSFAPENFAGVLPLSSSYNDSSLYSSSYIEQESSSSEKEEKEINLYIAAATEEDSYKDQKRGRAGARASVGVGERGGAAVCEAPSQNYTSCNVDTGESATAPRRSRKALRTGPMIDLAQTRYAENKAARFPAGSVRTRCAEMLDSLAAQHGREAVSAALRRYLEGGDDWTRRERWPLPYFVKHYEDFTGQSEAVDDSGGVRVLDAMIVCWNAAMGAYGPTVDASIHLRPGIAGKVSRLVSLPNFREKWLNACCRLGYAHYALVNFSVRRMNFHNILTPEGLEGVLSSKLDGLMPAKLPTDAWPILNDQQKAQHWARYRESLIAVGYKSGILPDDHGETQDCHRNRFIAKLKENITFNV